MFEILSLNFKTFVLLLIALSAYKTSCMGIWQFGILFVRKLHKTAHSNNTDNSDNTNSTDAVIGTPMYRIAHKLKHPKEVMGQALELKSKRSLGIITYS